MSIQKLPAMKTFICSLYLWVSVSGIFAQTGDTLHRFSISSQDAFFLNQTEGYLRGSFRFSNTYNIMVLGGIGLMAGDMIDGEMETLSVVGFEIGFAGVEISKYGPVPLVKARRSFEKLAPVWADTASYQLVLKRIRLAENLSKVSVISTFLGEGLVLLGFFQEDDKMFSGLIAAGVACGVVALGTSIGTTVATQMARVELGRASGSIAITANASGVGVAYRLP